MYKYVLRRNGLYLGNYSWKLRSSYYEDINKARVFGNKGSAKQCYAYSDEHEVVPVNLTIITSNAENV